MMENTAAQTELNEARSVENIFHCHRNINDLVDLIDGLRLTKKVEGLNFRDVFFKGLKDYIV